MLCSVSFFVGMCVILKLVMLLCICFECCGL